MNKEEIIKFAKEEFKDHVAKLTQLNEYTQEVEFKKPGTNHYYVRFVMSGNYLFVCGDLGEAVYQLTEQANFERIASGYDLGYLSRKLRTISGGKYTFDSETAIERIKDHMMERDEEYLDDKRKQAYDDLMDLALKCRTIENWNTELAHNQDICRTVDIDWWEWLPAAGQQLSMYAVLYWIALKMAAKQLKYKVSYFE